MKMYKLVKVIICLSILLILFYFSLLSKDFFCKKMELDSTFFAILAVIIPFLFTFYMGRLCDLVYSKFSKKSIEQRVRSVLKKQKKSNKKINSLHNRIDTLNHILIKESEKRDSTEKEYEKLSEEIKQLYSRPEEIFGLKK